MFNISNAPWSVGKDEKHNLPLRQPLREHELFGLPKSTGKIGDMTVRNKPLLQPVRLKDLFPSSETKKSTKKNVPARRTTTMPPGTSNASGKFRNKHSPGASSETTSFSCRKPLCCRQGLSRSEGKTKGFHRLAPENMNHLVESWETCQTAHPAAHKSRPLETRNANVRRKLYSAMHASPAKTAPINRTSVAPNALKSQKTDSADSKIVKSQVTKSLKPVDSKARKSCLAPPNSIREKYVNLQHTESKVENALLANSQDESTNIAKNDDQSEVLEKSEQSDVDGSERSSPTEILSIEATNTAKNEVERVCKEISRPTVIMGLSTRETGEEKKNDKPDDSDDSNDNEKVSLPNSCKLNVSLPDDHRGDLARLDRGESFSCENMPCNSFLESAIASTNSSVCMDRQTLTWIHGNLKLNVQSMEEQLFTLKRILITIEDAINNYDNEESRQVDPKNKSNDTSPLSAAPSVDEKSDKVFESKIDPEGKVDEKNVNNLPETVEISINTVEDSTDDRDTACLGSFIDEDKENKKNATPRRRSARLAEKSSKTRKSSEDSFLENEQDLNILHVKTRKTPLNAKPAKSLDSRARKSVREYMALKSASNFLATPNMKGFPTPKGEKNTPLQRRMERRSLSRKLLAELDDLYGDSPS